MGSRSPWEGAILGERGARCKAQGLAKTTEPIDLPFGLWTMVGRRKHEFNRMKGHIGATWRIRQNHPSAVAMRPYVKLD